MKIKTVRVNNYKRCFEIQTARGKLTFPFARCETVPMARDRVEDAFVDPELGNEAITYRLKSGKEGSIPLDAFLDYNRDPEYLGKMVLYRLTVQALAAVKRSGMGVRELSRRMRTSPSQLYRLLGTTNYRKTIDQMLKIFSALGYEVDFKVKPEPDRHAS